MIVPQRFANWLESFAIPKLRGPVGARREYPAAIGAGHNRKNTYLLPGSKSIS
jgi:hypothetical protein